MHTFITHTLSHMHQILGPIRKVKKHRMDDIVDKVLAAIWLNL